MPKERFHLYLADEVLNRCEAGLPLDEIHSSSARKRGLALYIGAISPDIFFYDVPSFSLSPLGNDLHDLIDREGISVIYDWIAQTSSSRENESWTVHGGASKRERKPVGEAPLTPSDLYPHPTSQISHLISSTRQAPLTRRAQWALGFACHFLTDAAWHPMIEELSGRGSLLRKDAGSKEQGLGLSRSSSSFPLSASRCCSSEIECHRLIESELEALWLPRSPTPKKYDDLLDAFRKDRGLLFEIASYYREFLEFAGLSSRAGHAPSAEVFDRRIVNCFLYQNFFLRLFANRVLGRHRDRLLSLSPTRGLGVLVTPLRTILPALFPRIFPEDRNPFSDCFMEQALASLELQLCAFGV